MLPKYVFFSLLLLSSQVMAGNEKIYGDGVVESVTSIYDADTFRVNMKDWPPIIGQRMPIRANGFDAPEIRGKCEQEKIGARKAKLLTVAALRNAKVIELRNMKRGKYFRIIADVFVDGESLKDMHLNAETARAYSGGKRQGWCP